MSRLLVDFQGRTRVFDEARYLRDNPDVAAALVKGDISSPETHYLKRGQFDGRPGVPLLEDIFDETFYLTQQTDVADAVQKGQFVSGAAHFIAFGHAEGRLPNREPEPPAIDWTESGLRRLAFGAKEGTAPHFDCRNPFPSEDMEAPTAGERARRYRCRWIEDSLTIHCDGNVSCGLDDPHALRSFGNVGDASVATIFANAEFIQIAHKLRHGFRCRNCSLYEVDSRDDEEFSKALLARTIRTLVVEPTVLCNLRCHNAACIPNNDASTRSRKEDRLGLDAFEQIVRQLPPTLDRLYFFNYGDPFVHPQAEQMLLRLRHAFPNIEIVTSTNGIPLSKKNRAEAVIEAQVDLVVFTISGMTQESYARYHLNGRLTAALDGLRNLCHARRQAGLQRTSIIWRYLLFRWNDSNEEIEQAIRLAEELGVTLRLYLTHMPIEAASFRFSHGSPTFARYARFIDPAHGYNCQRPTENGWFRLENLPNLGPARWSTAKARLRISSSGPSLRLALSTVRPLSKTQPQFVTLRTKWCVVRKALKFGEWNTHRLLVPPSYRSRGFEIEIEPEQFWFPAEELGGNDLRCLGVLLKPMDAPDSDGRSPEEPEIGHSLAEEIEDRSHGGRLDDRAAVSLEHDSAF